MLKKLCVMLLLCWAGVALAATGDDLVKNFNNLLRDAEKAFFSSRISDADEILAKANSELERLKTQDPENKSLKNLQGKYERLKKRVDQKQGETSKPLQAAPSQSSAVAGPGSGELKSGAVSSLKSADKDLNHAERYLGRAKESLNKSDFNLFGSGVYSVESHLEKVKFMFDRLEKSYNVTSSHPQAAPYFQRYNELKQQIAALKQEGNLAQEGVASAAAQAKATSQSLDEEWLPKIQAFTLTTGAYRIQSPAIYDAAKLAEQDQMVEKAKALLADYKKNVSGDAAGLQLSRAAEDLRFQIKVYEDQRNAGLGNLRQPVADTLDEWGKRFVENKNWKENSQTSLFIIRDEKIDYLKGQIAQLAALSPQEGAEFSARLRELEKENKNWVDRRQAWESRPRPFPEAKMSSRKLEQEMIALLHDQGWKVEKLVIVDKDWWVLKGEYRYLQTAALSEDGDGPFWSFVSFRQMQTLNGYAPTALWEINKKIRLP